MTLRVAIQETRVAYRRRRFFLTGDNAIDDVLGLYAGSLTAIETDAPRPIATGRLQPFDVAGSAT